MRNNRTPRFIIAGLAVPAEEDRSFRWRLAASGVRVLSAAGIRRGERAYTLAAPDALALWRFLDAHLGPVADRDVDAFIAAHVRRVEPRVQLAADQARPFRIRWHRSPGSMFGADDGLATRDGEVLTFASREEAAREAARLRRLVPGARLAVEP